MKLRFVETIGLPTPGGDGVGGFARDKIAKPVVTAGKAVGRAGKATGKGVKRAAGWVADRFKKDKKDGEED